MVTSQDWNPRPVNRKSVALPIVPPHNLIKIETKAEQILWTQTSDWYELIIISLVCDVWWTAYYWPYWLMKRAPSPNLATSSTYD